MTTKKSTYEKWKKKDFDEKEIIKLVENFMIVDKKIDIISMMFADY